MASAPDTGSPKSEVDESLISALAASSRRVWRSGGILALAMYAVLLLKRVIFRKFFWLSLLGGAGVGLLVAFGQSYAIGLYIAWKLYGRWWVLSPLSGPLMLALLLTTGSVVEHLERNSQRIVRFVVFCGVLIVLGTMFVVVGYKGAREDNPLLDSQSANLEALSKGATEQTRTLVGLSDSGAKLVNQLNATEVELEAAKRQLAVTLGNFDAQRHAAQQVSETLKEIDVREKQIALQTEELERILGGKQPITRNDLQRANLQGLFSGLVVGFVASLLASAAYNAFRRSRS